MYLYFNCSDPLSYQYPSLTHECLNNQQVIKGKKIPNHFV